MKRTAGRNSAVTSTVVLAFDLIMLFVSALLCQNGEVGFDGVLIPTIALFSSLWPGNRVGGPGEQPAKHLCGGEPGAGYLGRDACGGGSHRPA